jgi:hypothetical protein
MNNQFFSKMIRLFLCILAGWLLSAHAAAAEVFPGQEFSAAGFRIRVEQIQAGNGNGQVFLPFMNQWLPLHISGLMLDENGHFSAGLLETAVLPLPDFSQNEAVEQFQTEAWTNSGRLPLALNAAPGLQNKQFGGHDCILSRVRITAAGAEASAVVLVHTPEDQYIAFKNDHLLLDEYGPEFCETAFIFDGPPTTSNDPELPITILGSTNASQASRVEYDCNGFKKFMLRAKFVFPTSQLTPLTPGKTNVEASFVLESQKWGEFLAGATIDPFSIVGVDDVRFNITEAWIDYSTKSNPGGIAAAVYDAFPAAMATRYRHLTWKGFYIKTASIELPEGMVANNGQRFSIQLNNFFYTRGDGVSGDLKVRTNLGGNIEGWGFSLDSVLMRVIANSAETLRFRGGINVPVVTSSIPYQAGFRFETTAAGRRTTFSLNLNLAGEYQAPMLSMAKLILLNGSAAGIRYSDGKFQPWANLSGRFEVALSTPSVTLPGLEFTELKINDFTLPRTTAASVKTGGLDRISVKAFGFGGLSLLPPGAASAGSAAVALTQATGPGTPPASSTAAPVPEGQQKLSGFPISISAIKLGKTTYNNEDCYKLAFSIRLNFASGRNTFNASGDFGILAKIDFMKLLTTTPWDALKYRTTIVEGIGVNAQVGNVNIRGGLVFFNPGSSAANTYGEGFKGAFVMSVENFFSVEALAQFGTTKYSHNNGSPTTLANSYRYFFVDALATFGSGIPLCPPIPISLYGFGGGLFYNMSRESVLASAGADAMTTLGSTQSNNGGLPASGFLPAGLLEPGRALSPGKYWPEENIMGLKATSILGFSVPQTLMIESTLGIEFNYSDFAVRRLFFDGTGYVGSESVAKRREAAIRATVNVEFDFNNKIIQGSFGAQVRYPYAGPPMITGGYTFNEANLGRPCNFYFEGTGERRWWVMFGGPNNRFEMAFSPGGFEMANVAGYFMMGNDIPALPDIATVLNWPSSLNIPDIVAKLNRNFGAVLRSGRGIAFGLKTEIPRREFSFLSFYASFAAGLGFDVSLINFSHMRDQLQNCNADGTFGMNYWYLQGQAYGYFDGSVGMRVRLWFWSGRVTLASLTAGAVVQVKAPNPTYLKAYVSANYRVLGGAVRGRFNFKIEMGKTCASLTNAGPNLVEYPIINDISPGEGDEIHVFENPAVSFNFPVATVIDLTYIDDNGREQTKAFRLKLIEASIKKGSTVVPGFGQKWDSDKRVLTLEQSSMLEPKTDYEFRLVIGWEEKSGNNWVDANVRETQSIKFKTKERPDRIYAGMIKYHAPGLRQRYWTRNYAEPKLEFKTSDYGYLFTQSKSVNYTENGVQRTATTRVEYVFRLTNLTTKAVQERPLTGFPGQAAFVQEQILYKGVADGIANITQVPYLAVTNTSDIKVDIARLNDADIALEKGHVYKIEILRKPIIETPQITTITTQNTNTVNNTNTSNQLVSSLENNASQNTGAGTDVDNPTVAYTIETSTTALQNVPSYYSTLYQTDVLYSYHFGVSRYNSLQDKMRSYQAGTAMVPGANNREDWGYPDANANLTFKEKIGAVKNKYQVLLAPMNNDWESLDQIDQIRLRAGFIDLERTQRHPYTAAFYSDVTDRIFFRFALPYFLYERTKMRSKDGYSNFYEKGGTDITRDKWLAYARTANDRYYDVPDWGISFWLNNAFDRELTSGEITNGRLYQFSETRWYNNFQGILEAATSIPDIPAAIQGSIFSSVSTWKIGALAVQSQRERIMHMQCYRLTGQCTIMESHKKWGNTVGEVFVPYVRRWSILWEPTRAHHWFERRGILPLRDPNSYTRANRDNLKNLRFKWGLYLPTNPLPYFSTRYPNATPHLEFDIPNYLDSMGY